MPRSTAAPTTRSASCAVGATPKVAVPKQIRDTLTPVEPRTEYCISGLPCLLGDQWQDRTNGGAELAGWSRRRGVGDTEDEAGTQAASHGTATAILRGSDPVDGPRLLSSAREI